MPNPAIDAGAKMVYLVLRCGKRADVPWEDLDAADQGKFKRAFLQGLTAYRELNER